MPVGIKANPRALKAIREADMIVVGPGNLYSSILPHFLVADIRKAFAASRSKKVYTANFFTQPGHTDHFSVPDFLAVLKKYIGRDVFTHVMYNTKPIPSSLIKKYPSAIIEAPVGMAHELINDARYIGPSVFSIKTRDRSDPIAQLRNPFLHDAQKIGKALMEICG